MAKEQTTNKTPLLQDVGMERSVLSGIIEHGPDLLIEIEDILNIKDFYWPINQQIFAILKSLVHNDNAQQFDIPTILASAKTHKFDELSTNKQYEYIESLFVGAPTVENTLSIAAAVFKLSISRQAYKKLAAVQKEILEVTGKEKIEAIISKIEDPIFQFTGDLIQSKNVLSPIHSNFEEKMKSLSDNPKDIVGLPTGFPNWDAVIGGGFRRGTVNVLGARPKIGKSFMCLNIAKNLASFGIPVLYLDTELTQDIQMTRLVSLVSEVNLDSIESGKFASNEFENEQVWSIKEKIEGLPITHCSIAGHSIESILSLARRWLVKNVGFNESGTTNQCLIIYDYLKLMDSSGLTHNIQETQLLGFLITALHNFALKWNLPIFATVQLNRDGVEREGGDVISGSDRILWLCSNFTILKKKLQEEMTTDPPKNGTKKLVITDTRFGPGMEQGDYINIFDHLEKSSFKEGQRLSSIVSNGFNSKIIDE